MKFITRLSFLVILAMLLVACSDDDASTDSNEEETTTEETTEAVEEEPADESEEEPAEEETTEEPEETASSGDANAILSQIAEASNGVSSMSGEMYMLMEVVGGPESGKIEMDFTTDQLLETGEHHTKGVMSIDTQGQVMDMDMETYQKIDAAYTSIFGGGWMKEPGVASVPNISMTDSLPSINSLGSEFQVEERDGKMVLYLDAETIDSVDFLSDTLPEGQITIEEDIEYTITLNKYEIIVDPSTNLLEQMTFDVDMDGTDPEYGEMTMKITFDYVVTDYNHIDEIVVPQEVIDAAGEGTNMDISDLVPTE